MQCDTPLLLGSVWMHSRVWPSNGSLEPLLLYGCDLRKQVSVGVRLGLGARGWVWRRGGANLRRGNARMQMANHNDFITLILDLTSQPLNCGAGRQGDTYGQGRHTSRGTGGQGDA